LAEDLVNSSSDIKHHSLENIRRQCEQRGICEADRIVALTEGLRVVNASGQVGQVNASKAVDRSHIASDGESFRDLELEQIVFDGVSWNGVVDTNGSAVPVLAMDRIVRTR
jgi:hypothetical protein